MNDHSHKAEEAVSGTPRPMSAHVRPRPHHYMNADGTCHAGDLFEHGTDHVVLYSAEELVRILNAEKAEAWDQGLRASTYPPLNPARTNPYRQEASDAE